MQWYNQLSRQLIEPRSTLYPIIGHVLHVGKIAEILALGEGEPCLTHVERYSLDLMANGNDKSTFWNYIDFKVKRNKSKDKV